MNIAVAYISRSGNTKKVAEAIAEVAGVQALDAATSKVEEADLLFLGSAVYAANLDAHTKGFIDSLDPAKIKEVVLFGTSAGGKKPIGMMKKALEKKGVKVRELFFYCHGAFLFMSKGRPNEKDLEDAKAFAKQQIQ